MRFNCKRGYLCVYMHVILSCSNACFLSILSLPIIIKLQIDSPSAYFACHSPSTVSVTFIPYHTIKSHQIINHASIPASRQLRLSQSHMPEEHKEKLLSILSQSNLQRLPSQTPLQSHAPTRDFSRASSFSARTKIDHKSFSFQFSSFAAERVTC